MILSVTMNPSVDIAYSIPTFKVNDLNRVNQVHKTAGGKGLNVTRGIHLSGYPVLATGVIGGTTGEFICRQLTEGGIKHDFYETQHESRNCIAILHKYNQTEILEAGPILTQQEVNACLRHIERLVRKAKIITISGSLPPKVPDNYYRQILQFAEKRDIPVFLDCSGQTLRYTLAGKIKPFLIKPNQSELTDLIGTAIIRWDLKHTQKLTSHPLLKDIPCIVVSLGKQGAFAKHYNRFYKVDVPKIAVINPVGSGDVTLGGLAVGFYRNDPFDAILKRAMTMGILNALEKQTGCINPKQFDHYFNQIVVHQLNCA